MHYTTVKGILSAKNGMNLYRGCQHGCIYCDSRSACYHMEHDFEDVEVKENAIPLLEDALRRKRKPCMIGMGAMTDPYIPLEERLCHTRQALELALRYFYKQLDRQFPGLKEQYIRRYGSAYLLDSPNGGALMRLFHRRCKEAGILHDNDAVFQYLREFEANRQEQLSLF